MAAPKIGLVLGSGASRGWAHIGVIEALEKHGVEIGVITGASAGSFIGAAYAGGGLDQVKKFALDMDWKAVLSYLDLAFPRSGFIEGHKVAELVELFTKIDQFEDLNIPLIMVATNMFTGKEVTLSQGSITQALRASMAVPGLLTPKLINNEWLVDGGVVNPLPIDVCQNAGADIVIAVDINSERITNKKNPPQDADWVKNSEKMEKKRLEVIKSWTDKFGSRGKTLGSKIDQWFTREAPSPHIFEVLGSSINIMQKKIEEMNLLTHTPDVLLSPRLGDMSFFDFDHAERAIDEGYKCAEKSMPQILSKIDDFSSQN
ncbi:MAG: patatin family protein [Candidatus Marinimicrobia bacterium]|jgi:NTE family protein|nr:patatin family protein [Candidatus Neomarinimicrobiota bacterium]MBT3576659.1 patatin family protein [Candidatus Neomarinimicrobiota bacterium]MBT3678915.1 patatin family protein [Candidatus Neomarinimicrobiota bacterium]MBT3952252.1 patatin family protein [Candidatus Neomarinimicrobiota bacterium]MBT4252913.1 patatin family protein [Candidatus Neomarinimicrobiota bacterium]